jgi:hypothetical protein
VAEAFAAQNPNRLRSPRSAQVGLKSVLHGRLINPTRYGFVVASRVAYSAGGSHLKIIGCLKLRESLFNIAALEVRPEGRGRDMDGRANRGELKFNRRLAELLNASRACGTAITYESSSFKPKLRASECRAFSGTAAARLPCG